MSEVSELTFDKQEKAIREAITDTARESGSKAAKRAAKENDKGMQNRRRIAYQIFDESMDLFMEGMDMDEVADDLAKALKAID